MKYKIFVVIISSFILTNCGNGFEAKDVGGQAVFSSTGGLSQGNLAGTTWTGPCLPFTGQNRINDSIQYVDGFNSDTSFARIISIYDSPGCAGTPWISYRESGYFGFGTMIKGLNSQYTFDYQRTKSEMFVVDLAEVTDSNGDLVEICGLTSYSAGAWINITTSPKCALTAQDQQEVFSSIYLNATSLIYANSETDSNSGTTPEQRIISLVGGTSMSLSNGSLSSANFLSQLP